jgi:hypothetical protein
MSVVGVSVGRLRSAVTVLRGTFPTTLPAGDVPVMDGVVRIVPHSGMTFDAIPSRIIETIRTASESINSHSDQQSPTHYGVLDLSRYRGDSAPLSKTHTIVSHELRKEFGLIERVSFSQIRAQLGIRADPRESSAVVLEMFTNLTSIEKDSVTTKSALELMSESWGVARVLSRKARLAYIRANHVDLVNDLSRHIESDKKLFQGVTVDGTVKGNENMADVIRSLVDQQVDKILIKRFGI